MPLVSRLGAASSRGLGEFAQQTAANYIEDVFSTYVYTGNGTYSPKTGVNTINNGIDLSGKGGLVWAKIRGNTTGSHALFDTARGVSQVLSTDLTDAQTLYSGYGVTSFNSNGFTLEGNLYGENSNGKNDVAWTFRKQPKFFDVVTYTGTGSPRTIAHNLGSVPGMIIVKKTSAAGSWPVYHQSLGYTQYTFLDLTFAATTDAGGWYAAPTSTVFSVGGYNDWNQSGQTYVAYLFAHNAGGFGADGSQNVISCGSFTTDSGGNATVNLGYEPQYIIARRTDSTQDWWVFDTMRGWSFTNQFGLRANTAGSELNFGSSNFTINPNGFSVVGNFYGVNAPVIYMAIRRGPMKTPTSGTSVFNPVTYTGSGAANRSVTTTNQPDSTWWASRTRTAYSDNYTFDRLRGVSNSGGLAGGGLKTNLPDAEYGNANYQISEMNNASVKFGSLSYNGFDLSGLTGILWNFTRAPGFFDVVCYTATGSGSLAVSHNLSSVPQMMIVKGRSGASDWPVYHIGENGGVNPEQYYLRLNATSSASNAVANWGNTAPTSTQFTVGGNNNASGYTYVAYLFATCPGVSKVGSYTGTGSTQTISCGFTGGARYVLIKRTDSTGDWWVWDTARGMVSGTDPRLAYNSTAAETNADWVYTTTGGFQIVTSDATVNASGGTYIYLAIA